MLDESSGPDRPSGVVTTAPETVAAALTDFALEASYDGLPESVRDSVRLHILDTVGSALAGAKPGDPTSEALRQAASRWQRDGDSTASIWGLSARTDVQTAALVNGAFAQALEMDDKHGASLARPGSSVVPAVLAAAEVVGADLATVTTAVAVGYEVMIRLGLAAGSGFLARGYHSSALLGTFGTVVAVAKIRGLSRSQVTDALGIVGTFASGIQEATRTGATSKVLHGGWAAHSGCIAVDLAESGITGPDTVFEGSYGFYPAFLGHLPSDAHLDRISHGLGDEWYLPETAFKPYPCCQILHAFIDAAKEVRTRLQSDGLGIGDIDTIEAGLVEPGRSLVTDPWESKLRPTHPHEARFSLPYVVAHTLVHGDVGLDSFSEAALHETEVLVLAPKTVVGDDPLSDYPLHCPADLKVRTTHGKSYEVRVPYNPGSPEAPLSTEDVIGKFVSNTTWLFGSDADGKARRILGLDAGASISELIAILGEGTDDDTATLQGGSG